MPVWRETSRSIWFRLELSALTSSFPAEYATLGGCMPFSAAVLFLTGGGAIGLIGGRAVGFVGGRVVCPYAAQPPRSRRWATRRANAIEFTVVTLWYRPHPIRKVLPKSDCQRLLPNAPHFGSRSK